MPKYLLPSAITTIGSAEGAATAAGVIVGEAGNADRAVIATGDAHREKQLDSSNSNTPPVGQTSPVGKQPKP